MQNRELRRKRSMSAAVFKVRTAAILTLLLIWAIGATVKLYIYTVRDREILLKKSRAIAWREADLPAQRGKILDCGGTILAEDIFRCELVLEALPRGKKRAGNLLQNLREKFPGLNPDQIKFPTVLQSDLTAEEIRKYQPLCRRWPELRIAGRFERRLHPDPEIRKLIGKTGQNDRGETVGITGLEQKHDLQLSGKPGRIVVMLDRNGNWIYETLRVTRQPENGRDLKLDQPASELIRLLGGDHGK